MRDSSGACVGYEGAGLAGVEFTLFSAIFRLVQHALIHMWDSSATFAALI
jgi:hypothetical protein